MRNMTLYIMFAFSTLCRHNIIKFSSRTAVNSILLACIVQFDLFCILLTYVYYYRQDDEHYSRTGVQ